MSKSNWKHHKHIHKQSSLLAVLQKAVFFSWAGWKLSRIVTCIPANTADFKKIWPHCAQQVPSFLLSDQQHSENLTGCNRLHRYLYTLINHFPILVEPWLCPCSLIFSAFLIHPLLKALCRLGLTTSAFPTLHSWSFLLLQFAMLCCCQQWGGPSLPLRVPPTPEGRASLRQTSSAFLLIRTSYALVRRTEHTLTVNK